MNNKLIAVTIVVVVVLGGFLLFRNRGIAPTEVEVNSATPVPGSDVEEAVVVVDDVLAVKEFSIEEAPFFFAPRTISVNRGDTVKINVKNTKGTHHFKLDEFGASTRILNAGEEQTITFVADKSGIFEYYCSVGNHRALGMVGTLTVR